MFDVYLTEFFLIAVIHFFAVATPGPDFALILKQSIRYDRKTAIVTSLGIGTGILLHVSYSIIGLSVVFSTHPFAFDLLKYLAVSYFIYLGVLSLMAKPLTLAEQKNIALLGPPSIKKAFITGFLVNGLNVKATLFFIALFSTIISMKTPTNIKVIYGIYMALATSCWFIFLSFSLSNSLVKTCLVKRGYLLERLMGVILLMIALQILFMTYQ